MRTFRTLSFLAILATILSANVTAARQWKPAPLDAAQDYLKIEHALPGGQRVMIFWIAPQFVKGASANPRLFKLLDDNMVVAMLHFKFGQSGDMKHYNTDSVAVEVKGQGQLSLLSKNSYSSDLTQFTSAFKQLLAKSLGQLGKGLQLRVYDASAVGTCDQGTVWVNYLDEKYEYKTPLPGC